MHLHKSNLRARKVSGEFSVSVVKLLSREAEKYVEETGREFRLRFVNAPDSYFNMDMETAWLLLSNAP